MPTPTRSRWRRRVEILAAATPTAVATAPGLARRLLVAARRQVHAWLRRAEQAAAHGKGPEQGPEHGAAEQELELAAQAEPAPHPSSPPGTPPPPPVGLHWPAPTTPRWTADAAAVRLETLHETDGPDESPDRPPEPPDRTASDGHDGGANGARRRSQTRREAPGLTPAAWWRPRAGRPGAPRCLA